ncbi:MAG: CvpA family protein [Eubacterium sp.]|nr:CvpA family protein [Eubacterium sp.]
MSFIDLAFIIIAVIMVAVGARRGLIVSLLSTVRFIIGVPLSFYVSESYSRQVYDSFVKEIAYNKVAERLAESESVNSIISGVEEFTSSLPGLFSQSIDTSAFKGFSLDEMSRRITDSIVEPIAVIIIKVLLFIITFLVFFLVTGLVILLIKKLRKRNKTPLKRTSTVLGGVLGLLKALTLIFALSTILSYICDIIPQDNLFARQVNSSFVLNFINSYNPLLK